MGKSRKSSKLHPMVAAAAEGGLPSWAAAGRKRREHMSRVSDLLGTWAGELGLGKADVLTWRAAGYLHDALREATPSQLQKLLPSSQRDIPERAYHGPAAAVLMKRAGVSDVDLLRAVRWHTLGSRKFGILGRALYAADFLEPGRRARRRWREVLRERAPDDMQGVLSEIVASQIGYLLRAGLPVHRRTFGFWNSLVDGP